VERKGKTIKNQTKMGKYNKNLKHKKGEKG
jgi:hypothetical protein